MHPEKAALGHGIGGDHLVVFFRSWVFCPRFRRLSFALAGRLRFGLLRWFVPGETGPGRNEQTGQQEYLKNPGSAMLQMHGPTLMACPGPFQEECNYSASQVGRLGEPSHKR